MDSANKAKMREEALSDVSCFEDLVAADQEEVLDLLLRVKEDAYNEGYQDGAEAPPPEPSHHYE